MAKASVAKVVATKPIERSFHGLREALFDEIDGLRNGTSKPDKANSTSRLAAEIVRSVSAQIDVLRFGGPNGPGAGGLLS